MAFSTDTPPLLFKMEGVQEVSLALGHDEPVSVGCHYTMKRQPLKAVWCYLPMLLLRG